MLSQKTRYALKALIFLAEGAEDGVRTPQSANEIAKVTNVSRKYLESILVQLKLMGILVASRGLRGGYVLAREPGKISFAEVIRAIDGPLALVPCVSRTAYRRCEDCEDEDACALRRVLIEARNQISDLLEGTTLADAIIEKESAESYFSMS